MNREEKLTELRSLQSKVDTIRQELGISPPGKVLYQAPRDSAGDDLLIVEADGFGGAMASIVEGNNPVDYCIKFEKSFETEEESEAAAEKLVVGNGSPSVVLGAPI